MDLDGIAIFVKVIQAGSFSRAATLLGMPNSTVSAKVSALEKRLGVTLLQRTTRKLRVTQAGEAYFQRAVRALEELQAAENELETGRVEPTGLLRVTAPVEIGHSLLPALVHAFLKKHPRMEVELVVTSRVLDLVVDGIDLAIRAGPLKDSSLIAKRFDLGDFGLWASPDYLTQHATPHHPEELAQHNCLRFSRFKDDGFRLTHGENTSTSRSPANWWRTTSKLFGPSPFWVKASHSCRVFSALKIPSKTNSPAYCLSGAATKCPCHSCIRPNDSSRPKSAHLSR